MSVLRQLVGVWVIGSVLTGTLAVLFTIERGGLPIQPLAALPTLSLLGVFGLVAALFAALGLLAWGTPGTTWLPETGRGRALWVVLVAVAGLAGWAFAAAVTFAADFSLATQLLLAYVAGGLPFTLVATMLLRPVVANVAGAVSSALLLLVGWLVAPGVVWQGLFLLELLVLRAP